MWLVLRVVSRSVRGPPAASHLHPAEVPSSWLDHLWEVRNSRGLDDAHHLRDVVLGAPSPPQVREEGWELKSSRNGRIVPPC